MSGAEAMKNRQKALAPRRHGVVWLADSRTLQLVTLSPSRSLPSLSLSLSLLVSAPRPLLLLRDHVQGGRPICD